MEVLLKEFIRLLIAICQREITNKSSPQRELRENVEFNFMYLANKNELNFTLKAKSILIIWTRLSEIPFSVYVYSLFKLYFSRA